MAFDQMQTTADYDYQYAAPDYMTGGDERLSTLNTSVFAAGAVQRRTASLSRLDESRAQFAAILREDDEVPLPLGADVPADASVATVTGAGTTLARPVSPDEPTIARRVGRGGKKQKVLVDTVTELSARELKAWQDDLTRIQRTTVAQIPRPVSPFAYTHLSSEQRICMPTVRGLCPELQGLFDLTMQPSGSTTHMPFLSALSVVPVVEPEATRALPGLTRSSIGLPSGRPSDASTMQADEHLRSPAVDGTWNAPQGPTDDHYTYGYDEPDAMVYDEPTALKPGPEIDSPEFAQTKGALGADTRQSVSFETEGGADDEIAASGTAIHTWNARTAKVFEILKDQFQERALDLESDEERHDVAGSNSAVSFKNISHGVSRRTAAGSFLEILQLKAWGLIDMQQASPFADILLRPTDKLWALQETS